MSPFPECGFVRSCQAVSIVKKAVMFYEGIFPTQFPLQDPVDLSACASDDAYVRMPAEQCV